jgi:hypothetical protein
MLIAKINKLHVSYEAMIAFLKDYIFLIGDKYDSSSAISNILALGYLFQRNEMNDIYYEGYEDSKPLMTLAIVSRFVALYEILKDLPSDLISSSDIKKVSPWVLKAATMVNVKPSKCEDVPVRFDLGSFLRVAKSLRKNWPDRQSPS